MNTDNLLLNMTKDEACMESTTHLTELYNNISESEIDITPLELVLINSFGNGVNWANLKNEIAIKNANSKGINSGVWLAITELAFYKETQLIEIIIQTVGFSYEECMELMEESGCNNEIIQPIVESLFPEEIETDFTEEDENTNNHT